MRIPARWCSLALLATAAPLFAQAFPDDGPLAALSLSPVLPDLPSPSAPPTTQPTATTKAAAVVVDVPRDVRPFFLGQAETAPRVPSSLSPQSSSLSPLFPPYPSPVFSADTHLVAETALTWQSFRLPGQLKLGAWSESPDADLPTFPGGSRPNTWGPYLVLDQMLYRTNAASESIPRGVGLFLVYDHANADLFPTTEHLAAGLSFQGLLRDRTDDVLGLGLSYTYATTDPVANVIRDSETAVEVFYEFQITPHLTVRPDVQYVLDPASTHTADTVVASVRLELEY